MLPGRRPQHRKFPSFISPHEDIGLRVSGFWPQTVLRSSVSRGERPLEDRSLCLLCLPACESGIHTAVALAHARYHMAQARDP